MTETTRDEEVKAALIAGWEACRKSLWAVCEDIQNKAEAALDGPSEIKKLSPLESQHRQGFYRGEKSAAKGIARGFGAMNATDDDNLCAARDALLKVPPVAA